MKQWAVGQESGFQGKIPEDRLGDGRHFKKSLNWNEKSERTFTVPTKWGQRGGGWASAFWQLWLRRPEVPVTVWMESTSTWSCWMIRTSPGGCSTWEGKCWRQSRRTNTSVKEKVEYGARVAENSTPWQQVMDQYGIICQHMIQCVALEPELTVTFVELIPAKDRS